MSLVWTLSVRRSRYPASPSKRRSRFRKAVDIFSIVLRPRPAPLVKSPLSSFRPGPSKARTPSAPKPIILVDRPQHRQPAPGVFLAAKPDRLHHAVEHFAVVDLDDVIAALDPEPFQRIRRHHAHLGVGRDACRADRIGIELHELAKTPRPRLFVAKHGARRGSCDRALAICRNFPRHSGRAARSDHSATTASFRHRPGTKRPLRSGDPDPAGTCQAPR